MRHRIVHSMAVLAMGLMLGFGMVVGAGQPTVVHGADEPTPTPTSTTDNPDGQPGGSGGGHFSGLSHTY